MYGYTSKSPLVGYQVSKNTIVPSDCRHATNSSSGLVIVIGFFWSYGFSCTYTPKCWHWFGLMRVCSISSIYNAPLNTRMELLPLADVYTVAADTIGTSFIGVYFLVNGATSQLQSVYSRMTQFLPVTLVSAWLSISQRPQKGSELELLISRLVWEILQADVVMSLMRHVGVFSYILG